MNFALQTNVRASSIPASFATPVQNGLLQRKCPRCSSHNIDDEREDDQKKHLNLQRRSTNESGLNMVPPIVHDVLRSPGEPLPQETRTYMEPRFGHDFSRVRVHTDERAAESARDVNALAYTVGMNVVFGNDQFKPQTATGKKLIAHELAHVLQSPEPSPSLPGKLHIEMPDSAAEREADAAIEDMARGDNPRQYFFSGIHRSNSTGTLRRKPVFDKDCNEFNRCEVIEPLGAANQMLDRVLAELPSVASGTVTSGRIIDLLNVHFHDPKATKSMAATVLDNFRAIKAELNSAIKFICHPPEGECKSEKGSVGAFTNCFKGSEIGLCATTYYFVRCDEQARMLIHEMAHHIPGLCTDYAYVADAEYMTLPPEKASKNADTYAQFAKMVFLGTPSCKDCSSEVQLKPGQY